MSYSTLYNYNTGTGLNLMGSSIPVPVTATTSSGFTLVPAYGNISYDTLTSNDGSANKYFSISKAYGQNGGNGCKQTYIQKQCQ